MKILIVDDDRERHYKFQEIYHPQNEMRKAFNVSSAISELDRFDFDLVHLDYSLKDFEEFNDGRRPIEHTGMEVCEYLIKKGYKGKVIIHSWDGSESLKMKRLFDQANISTTYEPFNSFKAD